MSRFTDLIDAVELQLADPTVKFIAYKYHEGRNSQRRRVQWYRTGGTIGEPAQLGGRKPADVTEDLGATRAPTVYERADGIEMKIFAEGDDEIEQLLDNLIVAISRVIPNAIEWGGYEWDNPDDYAKRVPMVSLTMSVLLPVVDEIKPLHIIEDTGEECEWTTP